MSYLSYDDKGVDGRDKPDHDELQNLGLSHFIRDNGQIPAPLLAAVRWSCSDIRIPFQRALLRMSEHSHHQQYMFLVEF